MMNQPRTGPVRESDRILALDATRGFALLGILLVNIGTFGEAFGYFTWPSPRDDRGAFEWITWVLGKTFWEGRFYPLFSMLFGMGLVIQHARAHAEGRRFAPPMIRRLLVLAVIGALHALLIWYGDILFIYGIAGLLMLAFLRFSARVLFILAGSVAAFSIVLMAGLGMIQVAFERAGTKAATETIEARADAPIDTAVGSVASAVDAPITDEALAAPSSTDALVASEGPSGRANDAKASPFSEFLNELSNGRISNGPVDQRWIELETRAYRDGTWLDQFGFRAISWAAILVISLLSFGWTVLAFFLLGAAWMKCNIFDRSRRRWHVAFVVLAVVVATPVALAAAIATPTMGTLFHAVIIPPLHLITGAMIALGYLGAITLLVHAGAARGVTYVLSCAGRMAFTNYLMQSVIATAIFYSWGLGLFDSTTRLERIGIALAIYGYQLGFSVLWLRFFTMGPLEWFWRAATYLRLSPLRRGHAETQSPEG